MKVLTAEFTVKFRIAFDKQGFNPFCGEQKSEEGAGRPCANNTYVHMVT
jgi:hypothetical protein